MFEDQQHLPISLGYHLDGFDDNDNPIYVKDGLKWILSYADLADELQQKQDDILSFDDFEFKYFYNIDDYFFYNYQKLNPNELTVERQIKWMDKGLALFLNIFDEVLDEEEIKDEDTYRIYQIVKTDQLPYHIYFFQNNSDLILYEDIRSCPLDVRTSVKNALKQGYKHIKTKKGEEFKPFMYREIDDSKWIHDIKRLYKKLGAQSFGDIEAEGYNVDDYYSFNCTDYTSVHYLHWKKIQEVKLGVIQKISTFFLFLSK